MIVKRVERSEEIWSNQQTKALGMLEVDKGIGG